MFKSKLQELCHQYSWSLPEYTTVKDGPDHNSRFTATITVNGVSFQTPPNQCRSSKEAQNHAAKLAFDHFTAPKSILQHSPNPTPQSNSSVPASSSGFPTSDTNLDIRPANSWMLQSSQQENVQTLRINAAQLDLKDDMRAKDMLHLYKNRLQNYAQKRNLTLPTYSCETDGPPHARRFKSRVTIDGKTYETADYFSTLKDAEHAAAKVALESLPVDEIQDDEGVYKILLQELSQKRGFRFPTYDTTKSGPSHMPTFLSTVEIGGEIFQGNEAKTKKQAEMNAARVAYTGLIERRPRQNPTVLPPGPHIKGPSEVSSHNLQSSVTRELQPNMRPIQSEQAEADKGDFSQIPIEGEQAEEDKDVIVYGLSMEPFPSITYSPKVGQSLPSTPLENSTKPSVKSDIKTPAGGRTFPRNKVLVHPRMASMTHPVGTVVLPYSDHKWVAVKKADINQNQ